MRSASPLMRLTNLMLLRVVTNDCVGTSLRHAGDRTSNVILLDDACAALTLAHHRLALEVLDDRMPKLTPAPDWHPLGALRPQPS
jgi:nicotinamidase-related amidase